MLIVEKREMAKANSYLAFSDNSGVAMIIDPGEYFEDFSQIILDKNLKLKFIICTHAAAEHNLHAFDYK